MVKNIYYFLGSIYFALSLLAVTALVVAAATFTGSHLFYSSPPFSLLLALFFINILLSSLRRWPFRRSHIPFLLTHLGLLMLLAGAMGKRFGIEGTLQVAEGESSCSILLFDTYALELSSKEKRSYWPIASKNFCPIETMECVKWFANSRQHLEYWIKEDRAFLCGLPAFEVYRWSAEEPLMPPLQINIGETLWNVAAYRTSSVERLIERAKEQRPIVLLVEDFAKDEHLWVIHADGSTQHERYKKEREELIACGSGYQGYRLQSRLLNELQCSVTRYHTIEKNSGVSLPFILLRVGEEDIPLTFDPSATGLRWPILEGRYLVRFQPMRQEIPYEITLHQAKQINYPNSAKPKSYQALITITDRSSGVKEEAMLKMNRVYEVGGYRFYLSSLSKDGDVYITVNRDPFKYWLTYPGAFLLCLGFALFVKRGQ